jgi:hypothetical protein
MPRIFNKSGPAIRPAPERAEDFRNVRLFILHLRLGDEIHPNIGKIIHQSALKLFTGFAIAALMA